MNVKIEQAIPKRPEATPLVSIILVNWNGKDDLSECLESVTKMDYPNFEIIVVDNDSKDGSPQTIKKNFPQVKLLQQEKNVGFAAANNIGAKEAKGEFLFLLNPDTTVERNTLSALVDVMVEDPSIGSCAPKVYFYHRPDIIESTGGCVDNVGFCYARPKAPQAERGQFEKQEQVFMAGGGYMLLRRKIVETAGLFDPSLFFGYEELELGFKVRECGYKAVYVPTSRLYHKRHRSYSSTFTVEPTPFKMYRNTRNRIKIVLKYFPVSLLLKNSPLLFLSITYWNLWLFKKAGPATFAKAILSQVNFSFQGLKERLSRKSRAETWMPFMDQHSLKEYFHFYKQGSAFFNGDLAQTTSPVKPR